jgi:hypothetical protein
VLVVHGGRRAGEIVDLVDLHIERKRHVVTHQLEAFDAEQMRDVAFGAGEEVVDTDKVGAALQQALAQMRPEEAGPTGHQNALFEMHARSVHHESGVARRRRDRRHTLERCAFRERCAFGSTIS